MRSHDKEKSDMHDQEIGTALCIINKIQTTVDGGARLTLDLSSESRHTISELLERYLSGREMIAVGFAEVDQ